MIGLLGFLWLAGWLGVYQEPHAAVARDQARASSTENAATIKVPLAVHSVEGLQRSSLVFLRLLVPAISQSGPLIFTAGNRRDGLDTVLYGHRRESCGRCCVQRTVAHRHQGSYCAARCDPHLFRADGVCGLCGRQKQRCTMHCSYLHCNLWIFRRAGKSAGCSGRCVSERGCGFHLGVRQYGVRDWRNDFQPGDWLAGRSLLIPASFCTLRSHSPGGSMDGLDTAAESGVLRSAARRCA